VGAVPGKVAAHVTMPRRRRRPWSLTSKADGLFRKRGRFAKIVKYKDGSLVVHVKLSKCNF
jgi:hypothetical protein